jgi:hypothetical protein
MSSFLSMKAMRLFLAASVSMWMAGGCLFGCSNNAMAHEADDSAQAIVAGESCHAASSHDCCATKKKPAKQIVRNSPQPAAGTSFVPAPRGMMRDCPLAVSAAAAISKTSSHLPDPARGPVTVLPFIETTPEQVDTFLVVPFLPNRGPTYLRCCVFLI